MSFSTCAWAHFASMLSGGKFYIDLAACEGYSGARVDEVQAQILPPGSVTSLGQSGAKVSVPYGIRSTGVERVLVMALTNDVQYEGAQQATTNPNAAPAITRLRALWAYLRSIGIEPINVSLLPRGDEYAAAMPAWVAAEATAAATDGVQNIDVYTPCASGTAWKTGYSHKNGVVDPAFGLHPGADGCMLGIAPAVAAAITSTKTKTPGLVSAAKAELVRGAQSLLIEVLLNGSAQPYWDGLFASAGNWPIGFESAASTRTVAAGGIAHYGNRFRVACAAQAGEFYSDTRKIVPLVAGKKYALIGRVRFDAGAARPTPSSAADSFAISIRDAALNVFALFQSGSVDAYSTAGASVPEGSFCFPFVSPITGNATMLFEQRTQSVSTGSTMDLAQFQIIELP
jgi:hypothetical protein